MPLEIALKFVSGIPKNNPIPIKRYIDILNKENISVDLPEKELNKIKKRIDAYNNLADFIETITEQKIGIANSKELSQFNTPLSIFNSTLKVRPKMLYICKHIKEFKIEDLDLFTNYIFTEFSSKNKVLISHTEFRKYFNAYSMVKYGIPQLKAK